MTAQTVPERWARLGPVRAHGPDIAPITALLRVLVTDGLRGDDISALLGSDALVTSLAPDRVATGAEERPQLNLFLYRVAPHTALGASGEKATGHLPLTLHYLLTAYGAQPLHPETLLERAIGSLDAARRLDRDAVAGLAARLPRGTEAEARLADRAAEAGPLLITPAFLGTEEASRLWSTFQAKFRPSVAYRVRRG